MGAGISENYDNITPAFDSGFWKVHSAVHKLTRQPVTLWNFDPKAIKKASKSKADVQRYTDTMIQSVAQMRRLHHPHILKIIEVSENQKQFGFVAEAVVGTLESDETLNGDDITYVAEQLAEVLQFLHENAHIVNLTLAPDTVCVTQAIQVKLCAFNFCTSLVTPEVTPQYGPFSVSKLQPNLFYTAPEYLANDVLSSASDVFSYAVVVLRAFAKKELFTSKTVEEQYKQIEALRTNMPKLTSDALAETLQACLNFQASERPTIAEVVKSKGFLQLTVRSLRFIDSILTRDNEDKYRFYRGLLNSIPLFSERLLKYKLLPCFIDEVLADVRYGTALVPLILTIGKKYDKQSFDEVIIKPIAHILKMFQPEELALTNLAAIPLILEMSESPDTFNVIYSLLLSTLKSDSPKVRDEALKKIPIIITAMSEQLIVSSLLPTLLGSLDELSDVVVLSSVVEGIGECIAKVNPDNFAEITVPKLMLCWINHRASVLAQSIAKVFQKLECSAKYRCKYVMPMVCDMVVEKTLEKPIVEELDSILIKSVDLIVVQRDLENLAANYCPETKEESNVIAAPVEVKQLDLQAMEAQQRRASEPPPREPVQEKKITAEQAAMGRSLFGSKSTLEATTRKVTQTSSVPSTLTSTPEPAAPAPPPQSPPSSPLQSYQAPSSYGGARGPPAPPPQQYMARPGGPPGPPPPSAYAARMEAQYAPPPPELSQPQYAPPPEPQPAAAPKATLFSGMRMGGNAPKPKPKPKRGSIF